MWQAKIKLAASKSPNIRVKTSKNSLWEAWLECQENKDAERLFFFFSFPGRLKTLRKTDGCGQMACLKSCFAHLSFHMYQPQQLQFFSSSFFFYHVFAFTRLVYILSLTQIRLRSAVMIQAEGGVRWRGSRTTVRLRTGGKHKLSNHHLPALPKGSHLWNWWLNKSSHSESCNINTELKRKEVGGGEKKHWIMDQFLKAYT